MSKPIVLKREVVTGFGKLRQELRIDENEVVKRSWGDRYYAEIRLVKSKLGSYEIPVLVYIYGSEIEGNNNWRSIHIIPTKSEQIDELMTRITDFDSFSEIVKCIHELCAHGGDCDKAICDLNICIGKYCSICMTLTCDMSQCTQ
jgi:hypothetical protein